MVPTFLQCPHCDFPVIVRSADVRRARFCRQCHGTFVPALLAQLSNGDDPGARRALDARRSLRARVLRRKRAAAIR